MRYMDYDKFKKEYEAFEEWNNDKNWELPTLNWLHDRNRNAPPSKPKKVSDIREKIDRFQNERFFPVDNDGNFYHPESQNDMVNSPSHYTRGTQEAIDIIEEAIQDAPDVKAGMLQAQALKYLLRLWLKGNAPQDASKANWYLTRLINHLQENE